MTDKLPEDVSKPQKAGSKRAKAPLAGGKYHATPAELVGIDRGLKAAREGRFVTDGEIKAVFAKQRRK
jgi:predicted transcriptional regulator